MLAPVVPLMTKDKDNDSMRELPTFYQQVIHKAHYARWDEARNRRESWLESVLRYCNFFHGHIRNGFDMNLGSVTDADTPLGKAFFSIYNLQSMPSMRCMMTAGPALEFDNMCGFNCTYRAIDSIEAFDEIMYLLMCSCGVGFSVERQFTGQLPMIPMKLKASDEVIIVDDSRQGWAAALRALLYSMYEGKIPGYNTDYVRKKGARLKTMGGFASGPEPLIELFQFVIDRFIAARGRRLSSLDCHDIACKIGDCIVSGGVRRSALISLSNLSDLRMRGAKSGNWYTMTPWRMLANNSVCYTEKPEIGNFMAEWLALYDSKSGERGIFNRQAAIKKCEAIFRRTHDNNSPDGDLIDFGANPCAEIILRSQQQCNLTEIVARNNDTEETLIHKAGAAAMLGTWQSTLTNYRYVGPSWKINAEDERLLGVSITGIMDCPLLNDRHRPGFTQLLDRMRAEVRATNQAWAKRLGINESAATTTVKPSGTVSQLVDSGSGIHSRYAPFYKRRITMDNNDPVCAFLMDAGIPHEPSVMKPTMQTIFSFPIRSPEAYTGDWTPRSAIEQLEHWKAFNDNWAEHSVSCTVEVEEHEWLDAGAWVYRNFDSITGLSFLPRSNHVYQQAPFEAVNEAELRLLEEQMPVTMDWKQLEHYEQHDTTQIAKEFACVAGANNC